MTEKATSDADVPAPIPAENVEHADDDPCAASTPMSTSDRRKHGLVHPPEREAFRFEI